LAAISTRTGQNILRQARDVVRHGGGEQHRLACIRQLADDLPDVPDEAHVEHAVGLVEHQMLGPAQVNAALLHEIEKPARRCDQNVDAALHGLGLHPLADAAHHNGMTESAVAAIRLDAVGDLIGKFARRRENQSTRDPRHQMAAILGERLQQRQDESGGLAGPGLGNTEQILTVEQCRNGLRLDRRRRLVVRVRKGTQHALGKSESRKCRSHQKIVSLCAESGPISIGLIDGRRVACPHAHLELAECRKAVSK
jgi:hypothetical protein